VCKLCKRPICPPNCPNYSIKPLQEKPVYCAECGERILAGLGYYQTNGFPYCEYCLRFSDAESIIRICGNSFRAGLEKLGFTYAIV